MGPEAGVNPSTPTYSMGRRTEAGVNPSTPTYSMGRRTETGEVPRPLTAGREKKNPCPWEPPARVPMGQGRTGVSPLSVSRLRRGETPVPTRDLPRKA